MLRVIKLNLFSKIALSLIVFLLNNNAFAQNQKPIELLPHQQFPIDYLRENDDIKGAIVNHYMGTGKTYLGVGFAEHFKDKSIVILAPRFIEAHWMEHLKNFPVKDVKRYQFVSYNDAPKLLMGKDLSKTILIMDEVHNLIKLIKSPSPETNRLYSNLYEHLRSSFKILALSGTPIYNDEYDFAFLVNLVSGTNLLPFNEEQFRIQFTEIKKGRSFWRGYVFESNILKQGLPIVAGYGSVPFFIFWGASVGIPVLAVGTLGTILAFPIVDNWLAPLETFALRDLSVNKFKPYVSNYVSFFEIENQDFSEFPSKTIHVRDVSYNAEQFWFFLNFAEKSLGNKGLARMYKDIDANFDQTYLTLNTTILQNRLADTIGAGREIGNFEFDGENSLIESPKFIEVLQKIQSEGTPKTVVYSNYFENGIVAFAKFLDRKQLSQSYELLRPDMPADQFADIVKRYNDGQIKILLLHPEITEGISLKGTRQFHILEPVTNLTVLNQVIARAVRYQSHTLLAPNQRHVDVYVWKAVIGSRNYQTLKLQKANWFKRYSELSDWSNYGQGISQIDKNYDRKRLSPDAQTYMRLESVNQNMDALKGVMKAHSIEKGEGGLDSSSLSAAAALVDEQENIKLDPFVLPKTNLRAFWRFGQELTFSPSNRTEKMNDSFGLNLEIEIPIWANMASGFYLEGYKGYSAISPRSEPSLDLNDPNQMSMPNPPTFVIGVGGFVKPQVKIPVPFGDLALSLRIPFGVETVFAPAATNLFKDADDIKQFKLPQARSISIAPQSGLTGIGLTTGATLGVEYYPIEFGGIFFESGYQASYHMFQPVLLQEMPSGTATSGTAMTNAGLRGYLVHGFSAMAGLKLTY